MTTKIAQQFMKRFPGPARDAQSVINGAFGDRLSEAGSPLAIDMSLHGPDRAPLGDPLSMTPDPKPEVAVLVHGLMASENSWSLGVRDNPDRVEMGEALAGMVDVTPIYVRYNTGCHISSNGRALAEHLERLVHAWPDVERLNVVGHSMGGLVSRSACHYGLAAGHAWVDKLRRVFLLGSPSHGAPLEQLAHVVAFTLESIWNPWTHLIGRAINLRSDGIKDLRHGFVLDEDWRHRDPDVLALRAPRVPARPEGVEWFAIAGTLGDTDTPAAKVLGDALVTPKSVSGRGFGTEKAGVLEGVRFRVFDRVSHMALMNDWAVVGQVVDWWRGQD